MAAKLLYLDFEFKNFNEQAYNVVCCCTMTSTGQEQSFWLYEDPFAQFAFLQEIQRYVDEGYILVAWVASAEMRALLSLEYDIDQLQIIDAQVEYKFYANTDSYQKWIMDINLTLQAEAQVEGIKKNKLQTGFSLACAYALLFGKSYDEKDDMRRLIVGSPTFTKEEEARILEYCMKDVHITRDILQKTSRYMVGRFPELKTTYLKSALKRGEYVKATTWIEWMGYPIDRQMLEKVGKNLDVIQRSFVTQESQDIQDLWIRTVHTKKGSYEEFKFSNKVFEEKIEKLGLTQMWPKTPTGKLKTNKEALEDFAGQSEFIEALQSVNRKMACINYLTLKKEDTDVLAKRKLRSAISSAGRIHCYLNPYGTTTGRNAPPASIFVFAQSSWQRVLVRPQPGRVIIGLDYRAEEILIAGIVGQDDAFLSGYATDPYISFAIAGGFIPAEDSQLSIGELKKKYADLRNKILKPVVLGMNYGMGAPKLAKTLGLPEQEARPFHRGHKQVYRDYWRAAEGFAEDMKRSGRYFALWDDWGLYETDRYTKLINWQIQAWGGAIIRALSIELTQRKYRDRNIQLICSLHDAAYLEVDENVAEEVAREVEQVMVDVFYKLLPNEVKVEVEWQIHHPDEFWIEQKAVRTWEIIKPYIVG